MQVSSNIYTIFLFSALTTLLLSTGPLSGHAQQKQSWLKFIVPVKDPDESAIKKSGETIHYLVLAPREKLHYYGENKPDQAAGYSFKSDAALTSMLHEKTRNADKNVLLIKSLPSASFRDFVRTIRLVTSAGVKRYAWTSASEEDNSRFNGKPDSVSVSPGQRLPDTINRSFAMVFDFVGDSLFFFSSKESQRQDIAVSAGGYEQDIGPYVQKTFGAFAGNRVNVYIAGDRNTRFESLKKLIDLLRKNNWYTYYLLEK